MQFSNNTYDVTETQYHIVGRQEGQLLVFNTPYEEVNVEAICDIVDKESSISFNDGINEYSFNKSKSVLQKRFTLPDNYVKVSVDILNEPLELLSSLLKSNGTVSLNAPVLQPEVKGYDYVILPLYSKRGEPHVPERSGLFSAKTMGNYSPWMI